MFEVREVEKKEVVSLRHQVLRPHQSIEDCIYDTDDEEETFHVGAYHQGKLVSVASFNLERLDDFQEIPQYRLRAMATLEQFRRLGAGRQIVEYAQEKILRRSGSLLWCKGRTGVTGYYERLGFRTHGEEFDYPPIGMHVILFKRLDSFTE